MKKIRVLQIVPSLSQANGVASYISTYLQKMNRNNFEFTFLVLNDKDHGRYDEIENCGAKIIEIFKEKNIIRYFNKIRCFFDNNSYDIVHCHTPNYGVIFLYYAKRSGVKKRILHSHVNRGADKLINRIRNYLLSRIAVHLANEYLACTDDAGKFLFGNRDYTVIKNAIDINKYKFDNSVRKKLRNDFNINNKIVLGEFGRLCPQKNQLFLLDIFKKICDTNDNYLLVLAGNGQLETKIKDRIKKYNLNNKVLMLGSRNDLDKLYNMLDLFVMPSIYEGLGIVLIEAQANGLRCFTSLKNVPNDAKVSDILEFIELNNNSELWADKIINTNYERKDVRESIRNSGYDIDYNAKILRDYYINIINK